jgi:hypothetical protein
MNPINKSKITDVLLISLVLVFLSTKTAYAYLDPGSGSYIIQFIIAGFVGGLFAIKTFWLQIKTFITGLSPRNKKKDNPALKKKNVK